MASMRAVSVSVCQYVSAMSHAGLQYHALHCVRQCMRVCVSVCVCTSVYACVRKCMRV